MVGHFIMHLNGSFTCLNVFWIIIITIRIYAPSMQFCVQQLHISLII